MLIYQKKVYHCVLVIDCVRVIVYLSPLWTPMGMQ